MSGSRAGINSGFFNNGNSFSESELVPEHKVKLFLKLFNFLSLYYGSDNKVIQALGLNKAVKYSMIDKKLNKKTAQKILDAYNEIKKLNKD